ncbi:TIR domain-containing protein [Rhizobium sp. S-51]|uniref:TIR domain-containing protein n=1 Tax=Rhizobium terricola TaxID=2728849 RepID=A0A7Y0FUW4_9HYPH|nr:TIR domain-containing protein [Rhizobium terricola]NML73797.1 TIR domain-containing protein [Rhizobium terricola]
MKVFISWSGDLSREVAVVLRDWLPSVIQSIEPYVSSEDIDKGTRWSSDIASELETSSFGILCVTGSNIHAPWINFEAGALSKSVESSRVSPFLFNIKRSDVSGPLVQFQSTINEKEDIFKLLNSINDAEEKSLPIDRLRTIFDVWWPKLEEHLSKLESKTKTDIKEKASEKKKESDILEEVLELVRSQTLIIRDPEKLLPPAYLEYALKNRRLDSHAPISIRRPLLDLAEQVERLKLALHDDNISRLSLAELIADIEQPLHYMLKRWGTKERI